MLWILIAIVAAAAGVVVANFVLKPKQASEHAVEALFQAKMPDPAGSELDLSKFRGKTLVVNFWAPWCGPCRMMAPEFSKAATALKGKARLVKLNTEQHQKAAAQFGIRGIPTLIAFGKGREAARQSGALPAAKIEAFALRSPEGR